MMKLIKHLIIVLLVISCDLVFSQENVSYGKTIINGTEYKTIKIGNQTWLAENLKEVPENVKILKGWVEIYENDSSNLLNNGLLFKGLEAARVSNLIKDWRLPKIEDWNELIENVKKINKENPCEVLKHTAGWISCDETDLSSQMQGFVGHHATKDYNGSNLSGFSAIPSGSGVRNIKSKATFEGIGKVTYFWVDYFSKDKKLQSIIKIDCKSKSIATEEKSSVSFLGSVRLIQDN